MSWAQTPEPVDMPFGLWTWLGPRNHVLGGGFDPKGKGQFCGHVQASCEVL